MNLQERINELKKEWPETGLPETKIYENVTIPYTKIFDNKGTVQYIVKSELSGMKTILYPYIFLSPSKIFYFTDSQKEMSLDIEKSRKYIQTQILHSFFYQFSEGQMPENSIIGIAYDENGELSELEPSYAMIHSKDDLIRYLLNQESTNQLSISEKALETLNLLQKSNGGRFGKGLNGKYFYIPPAITRSINDVDQIYIEPSPNNTSVSSHTAKNEQTKNVSDTSDIDQIFIDTNQKKAEAENTKPEDTSSDDINIYVEKNTNMRSIKTDDTEDKKEDQKGNAYIQLDDEDLSSKQVPPKKEEEQDHNKKESSYQRPNSCSDGSKKECKETSKEYDPDLMDIFNMFMKEQPSENKSSENKTNEENIKKQDEKTPKKDPSDLTEEERNALSSYGLGNSKKHEDQKNKKKRSNDRPFKKIIVWFLILFSAYSLYEAPFSVATGYGPTIGNDTIETDDNGEILLTPNTISGYWESDGTGSLNKKPIYVAINNDGTGSVVYSFKAPNGASYRNNFPITYTLDGNTINCHTTEQCNGFISLDADDDYDKIWKFSMPITSVKKAQMTVHVTTADGSQQYDVIFNRIGNIKYNVHKLGSNNLDF